MFAAARLAQAYQAHFAAWADHPLKLVEIGVQSGGSLDMWHSCLGPECHVYGTVGGRNISAAKQNNTEININ